MELGTAVIVVIGAMIVLVPRGVGEGITTNIEKRLPVQGSEHLYGIGAPRVRAACCRP
jgi:hypothetical protein